MLCEMYLMPELFEISERYPIPYLEENDSKGTGKEIRKPEKKIRITVELTEKEANACDTLLLAEQFSPVASPLHRLDASGLGTAASIDMAIGEETLSSILTEAAEEVASLSGALKF